MYVVSKKKIKCLIEVIRFPVTKNSNVRDRKHGPRESFRVRNKILYYYMYVHVNEYEKKNVFIIN